MAIADRKQRAFEAREKLAVEHADELLLENGYLGLNLEELAERIEYSKATLYHHFCSKEDLVLAVVQHHLAIRHDFFSRAVGFGGKTRERMFAIGIADRLLNQLYPHGFPLIQLVRSPSIWSKCSEARRTAYFSAAQECFQCGMVVVGSAAETGDLGDESPAPDQIVWGLISLSKGAHLISEESTFREHDSGESEPLTYLFDNYHRFLDGVGWQPFTRDFDYSASHDRILLELFAEESKRISPVS